MAKAILITSILAFIILTILFFAKIHMEAAEELKNTQRYANFLHRWNQLCQEESDSAAEPAESEEIINERSTEGSF